MLLDFLTSVIEGTSTAETSLFGSRILDSLAFLLAGAMLGVMSQFFVDEMGDG